MMSGALVACGGNVVVDGSGAGGSSTVSTTGSVTVTSTFTTTMTTTVPPSPACGGLDFCACSHTDGCEVVYGDCICSCDYACFGEPPCDCDCGGGPYFGCAPSTCPGPFNFSGDALVSFDAAGCPVAAVP